MGRERSEPNSTKAAHLVCDKASSPRPNENRCSLRKRWHGRQMHHRVSLSPWEGERENRLTAAVFCRPSCHLVSSSPVERHWHGYCPPSAVDQANQRSKEPSVHLAQPGMESRFACGFRAGTAAS